MNSAMTAPLVDVVDLQKSYGGAKALDGVSFQVAQGEIFGLLGPNGAGKSTLVSILACLLEPSSGEARILGRRADPADRTLRSQLGIVPQELALYSELTARENLEFFGRLYGVAGAALRERVAHLLDATGLVDQADHPVATFSGGMKRRLNLGAALVHEPKLVLLDEPAVGVDPQSRAHLFEEIRRLHQGGTTILYISHYIEEVQTLCSRVGIIDHGRLIACDTLPALLQLLPGLIRFRVSKITPELREQLSRLPDTRWSESGESRGALECRDVKNALPRLIAILVQTRSELLSIETIEPNLERVFLHLTGSTLRD
ncbi:MAG TPA: ABC transporter ATP-binding protein [Pirellulales bacterium]|jgi:ABC-2 type transport system ATP-binding protein|nr:ABC transporter ATP-binding protein [Pirellulales bacterium]